MTDYITSREQTTAEHYLRWAVQNSSKRGYVKLPRDKVLEIAEYIERTRDAEDVDAQPTADVRDYATAHKVVGGGERDGATCWFECDNCGLAVDIADVFCKHCGARFVP